MEGTLLFLKLGYTVAHALAAVLVGAAQRQGLGSCLTFTLT